MKHNFKIRTIGRIRKGREQRETWIRASALGVFVGMILSVLAPTSPARADYEDPILDPQNFLVVDYNGAYRPNSPENLPQEYNHNYMNLRVIDVDNNYSNDFYAEFEVQDVNTPFTGEPNVEPEWWWPEWDENGYKYIEATLYDLEPGQNIHLQARVIDYDWEGGEYYSEWVGYGGNLDSSDGTSDTDFTIVYDDLEQINPNAISIYDTSYNRLGDNNQAPVYTSETSIIIYNEPPMEISSHDWWEGYHFWPENLRFQAQIAKTDQEYSEEIYEDTDVDGYITIEGLEPGASYQLRVRAVADDTYGILDEDLRTQEGWTEYGGNEGYSPRNGTLADPDIIVESQTGDESNDGEENQEEENNDPLPPNPDVTPMPSPTPNNPTPNPTPGQENSNFQDNKDDSQNQQSNSNNNQNTGQNNQLAVANSSNNQTPPSTESQNNDSNQQQSSGEVKAAEDQKKDETKTETKESKGLRIIGYVLIIIALIGLGLIAVLKILLPILKKN